MLVQQETKFVQGQTEEEVYGWRCEKAAEECRAVASVVPVPTYQIRAVYQKEIKDDTHDRWFA